jgi:hypothetical protein
MPFAAHTTGGHSTLDLVLGIAILLCAFASATALLSWLARLPRRYRKRTPGDGWHHSRFGRPLVGDDTDPNHTEHPAPTMTGLEHNTGYEGGRGPGAGIPTRPAGHHGRAVAARRPSLPAPRCSPETLEPLARSLDTSHRLAIAEARVAETLGTLPSDRWLLERYALIAGHRIPFLMLGETGVFVICALTGPPAWDELRLPAEVVEQHIVPTLPGYTGPMRVGLCRALATSAIEPRWWCRPGEAGAWMMGLESLIAWIEHFGTDHGLGITDLRRLRELAAPKPGPGARAPDVVPDLG